MWFIIAYILRHLTHNLLKILAAYLIKVVHAMNARSLYIVWAIINGNLLYIVVMGTCVSNCWQAASRYEAAYFLWEFPCLLYRKTIVICRYGLLAVIDCRHFAITPHGLILVMFCLIYLMQKITRHIQNSNSISRSTHSNELCLW